MHIHGDTTTTQPCFQPLTSSQLTCKVLYIHLLPQQNDYTGKYHEFIATYCYQARAFILAFIGELASIQAWRRDCSIRERQTIGLIYYHDHKLCTAHALINIHMHDYGSFVSDMLELCDVDLAADTRLVTNNSQLQAIIHSHRLLM